jgi:flavin-dependent dehydrogenase
MNDIIVIGAGIAGASVAAHLTETRRLEPHRRLGARFAAARGANRLRGAARADVSRSVRGQGLSFALIPNRG